MRRTVSLALRAGLALCWAGAWLVVPERTRADGTPDVYAVYETRVGGARELRRWSFTRRGSELEYHFLDKKLSERWRRDARGNPSYSRVFHGERTIVRYMHGDLLAFGVKPDWSKLSHVVSPPAEAGFVRGKPARVLGHDAARHHGELGAKRLEIMWIDALQIPAEVQVTAKGRPRIVVRLVELQTEVPALLSLTDYRQIDVTDFGDMERDPFVVRHHGDPVPGDAPSLAVHEPLPSPSTAVADRRGPPAHRH